MRLWQYPVALCCCFRKYLCGMKQHTDFVPNRGARCPERCSSTGLPSWAEVVTDQTSLSHKVTEQRRVGSEMVTSVSEALSLQLGCFCIFPFGLPTQIYLIYPIYPFLLTAQTAGAIELQSWGHNILVKISKKSDGDGTVPMLGASMAGQMVWLGCKRVSSAWLRQWDL